LNFKLTFDIPKRPIHSEWPVTFMMGSCFAENQGLKMQRLGFDCFFNPFGVLYNPVSMAQIIERLAKKKLYNKEDFNLLNHQYFCWEHHGLCHFHTLEEAINTSNQYLLKTENYLKKSNLAIFTLGTSLVYEYLETKEVVANCHKIPNNSFSHRPLSYSETHNAIEKIIYYTRELNPNIHIIFTISPVRHLKSGIQENFLSKSTLRSAIQPLLDIQKHIDYFPAFEILIDELRDYRFTKNDLMHPTEDAVEYIWQRFVATYFSVKTLNAIDAVEKYLRFEEHRPFNHAEKHYQEAAKLKTNLLEKYPFIQWNS
jgi:hypothetical protein